MIPAIPACREQISNDFGAQLVCTNVVVFIMLTNSDDVHIVVVVVLLLYYAQYRNDISGFGFFF